MTTHKLRFSFQLVLANLNLELDKNFVSNSSHLQDTIFL